MIVKIGHLIYIWRNLDALCLCLSLDLDDLLETYDDVEAGGGAGDN
jgi:hypothetical protein